MVDDSELSLAEKLMRGPCAAFRSALKERNPITSALVAALLSVLVYIGLASDLIDVIDSPLALVLAVVVFIGVLLVVYFVRFLDELADKKPLLAGIDKLESQVALLKDHLATTQARLEDLTEFQSATFDLLNSNLLYHLEDYLEEMLSQIELAQQFAGNDKLARNDLATTCVQLYEGRLAVSLPIGKNQGAVKNLAYSLSLPPKDPSVFPTTLGKATLIEVDDERSLGLVQPAQIQQAFWDSAYSVCRDRGSYEIELRAIPAVRRPLQDCSPDALSTMQQFLKEMVQDTKRAFYATTSKATVDENLEEK